jgi:uncharacterized protein YraI
MARRRATEFFAGKTGIASQGICEAVPRPAGRARRAIDYSAGRRNMKSFRMAALLLLSCCFAGLAHAVEFKSIGATPAILYDAPTERGRKIFVAPRGMPVEVVLTNGDWIKVRDAGGDLTWVESKSLVSQRTVIGNTPNAKIRSAPNDASPVVFSIDKGVLLDVMDPITSGWIKVKHKDGQTGYVKAGDVWGD